MKTIMSGFAARVFGLAAVVAVGACASTQVLTQGEVGRSGARAFNEPKGTMFAICVGTLTAEGYEIARSDVASGVIETKPLAVHTPGPVTARAYRVTVTAEGQGSRVVAQPILFAGTRDVSNSDVWVLDGPEGERAQWSDLFGVMNRALVTPGTVAPAQQRQDEGVAANGAASPSLAKERATPASDKGAAPGQPRGLTPAGLSAPQGPSSPDARP
jgi:hypothetical protein